VALPATFTLAEALGTQELAHQGVLARISHQFSRVGFEGAESLDSSRVLKAFVEKPPVDEPA
jgi:hypothetical protein